MYLPQNDKLKCHIVLNPPKLGNRTQFLCITISPAAQILGCMVYYDAELRHIELNFLKLHSGTYFCDRIEVRSFNDVPN
jgi:hypothetical protein